MTLMSVGDESSVGEARAGLEGLEGKIVCLEEDWEEGSQESGGEMEGRFDE